MRLVHALQPFYSFAQHRPRLLNDHVEAERLEDKLLGCEDVLLPPPVLLGRFLLMRSVRLVPASR
jgi:hypothetical protein